MKVEKISITRDDVMLLLTMESGGFDYWGTIDCDSDEYVAAKAKMKESGEYDADGICYEDVLAYMIWNTDYPVYVVDIEEEDEEEAKHRITKENLEQGFLKNLQKRPEDGDLENGDAVTGDCILQYAIFGDIIYG